MNKTLITFFTVLFCMISSVGWSLEYKDLVKRDGVYYKKFSDVPFTGKVTGQEQGSIKNGKKDGSWIEYWDNGQLKLKGNWKNGMSEGSWVYYYDNGKLDSKGDFKNGHLEGSWVSYKRNGTVSKELTGTYKNGKKISD